MKEIAYYPGILQRLFPGHPARQLLCTDVYLNESGEPKKKVVTKRGGARMEDYTRHLSRESSDGVGALGVIPTYPEQPRTKSPWLVAFLTLDWDTIRLEDIQPLIDVLDAYRVYAYLDRGTTGRSVHLSIFLSVSLFQWEAHAASTTIANLSKHLGLPKPEVFPSSAYGKSLGVFLPYRGAEEDGYGANPLIDPISGSEIHLGQADEEIARTEPEDLLALVASFDQRLADSTPLQHEGNESGIDSYATGVEAWEKEVQRLGVVWTEGRRQKLALGAPAYAIAVGVTIDRVREDIQNLEEGSANPEVEKRLEAVNRTFEKDAKGERVAWREFYRQADVEPPRAGRVIPWNVQLKLKILANKLQQWHPKGMGGFTDRDVIRALIEVGERYGKPHPEGVEVSISVRELAQRARVDRQTIQKSLERLGESGWVERSDRGRGTHSGSLVLLINDQEADSYEWLEDDESGSDDLPAIPMFRWGKGKLGKMSKPILEKVRALQPCTRAEVARAMGRESRDIRNQMNRLLYHRLVEYDEDTNTYYLPSDFESRLFDALLADGTWQTDYKHRKRFERDRIKFKFLRIYKKNTKHCSKSTR